MRRPGWVLWGNRFRRAASVAVPVWWEAVRWGSGLFETVGCDGGRPLLWHAHSRRLHAALRALAWPVPPLPGEELLAGLLVREGLRGSAALRVLALRDGRRVRVVAWAVPYTPPQGERSSGVVLHAIPLPSGPLTGLKTCAHLPYRWAHEQARASGADAALLLDPDGIVREADSANLFAVLAGKAMTPPAPARCLPGVLRRWCLDALSAAGIAVEERGITLEELLGAQEVWLSSSLAGVVPVRAIGGCELPVPRRLVALLEAAGVPAPGYRSQARGSSPVQPPSVWR